MEKHCDTFYESNHLSTGMLFLLIGQSRNRPTIGHTIDGFHVNVQLSALISVASNGPTGFPGTSVKKEQKGLIVLVSSKFTTGCKDTYLLFLLMTKQ